MRRRAMKKLGSVSHWVGGERTQAAIVPNVAQANVPWRTLNREVPKLWRSEHDACVAPSASGSMFRILSRTVMLELWALIYAPFAWCFSLALMCKRSPPHNYTNFYLSALVTVTHTTAAAALVLCWSSPRLLVFAYFFMDPQTLQPQPTTGAMASDLSALTTPSTGSVAPTPADPAESPAIIPPIAPPSTTPSPTVSTPDPNGSSAETSSPATSSASPTSGPPASLPTSHPSRRGPKGARHIQPQKSGRKSTWPPKKLAWLESRVAQFTACNDSKAFYDRLLWLWYKVFGRSLPIKDDPEDDIDEAAAIARQDAEEFLTEEVRSARNKEEQALRQVRIIRMSLSLFIYSHLVLSGAL